MKRTIILRTIILALLVLMTSGATAGNLEPPGPPDSTMKTLGEVQPCIPVQHLPGNESAIYIINAPGSYYLTGNIIGENAKHGILVQADNVTIDLKGFSLIGAPGSQSGICFDPGAMGGAVGNGMIRLWGGRGIDAEDLVTCRVADITSIDNGSDGIRLGTDGLAKDCVVRGNAEWGISGNDNCLIVRCVARENGSGGYRLVSGGSVKDCVAEKHQNQGILVKFESTVENCLSSLNGTGIEIMNHGCSVRNNNCVSNYDHGILLKGKRCLIDSNMVTTREEGIGITVTDTAGASFIVRNTVALTRATTMKALGYSFFMGIGLKHGPLVGLVTETDGDISGVTNANHPWANFVY